MHVCLEHVCLDLFSCCMRMPYPTFQTLHVAQLNAHPGHMLLFGNHHWTLTASCLDSN